MMADSTMDSTEIQNTIRDVYIPFLRKLIAHLEKKKDSQAKLKKLKFVYTTFTEADNEEKVQVYYACKGMLDQWHKRYKDMTKKKAGNISDALGVISEDSQSESSVASNSKSLPGSSKTATTESSATNGAGMPFAIVSVVSCSDSNPAPSTNPKLFSERHDGVYFQDEIEIEPSDSSATDSILPGNNDNQGEKWKPVQIKKEKEDPVPTQAPAQQPVNFGAPQVAVTYGQPQVTTTYGNQPVTTYAQPQNYGLQYKHSPSLPVANVNPISMQPVKETLTTKMLNARKAQQEANNQQTGENTVQKEVTFVCASCQFRTLDETEFMKHARTDHRTDLSLWCKQCGKCFSNAGVLVAHIKEDNCQKEEMIYRCGVKECTFETPSGQTFVHHLRHCHKGSPFIFCIHCQKIFTLPHCLILHMQNECPFKEKNRRFPGQAPAPVAAPSPTVPVATTPVPKPTIVAKQAVPIMPKLVPPSPATNSLTSVIQSVLHVPSSRGRVATLSGKRASRGGRGRGRGGRGSRSAFSDSSDSDDPDDPNWRPDESLSTQPLRRSARWAKKLSDVANPETYESDSSSVKTYGKTKTIPEQPGKTFFHCPCCDFSALFRSLLEDHYITDHKNQKKNACLVCNVKFESVKLFIEHFSVHEKEKENKQDDTTNQPSVENVAPPVEQTVTEKSIEPTPSKVNVETVPGNYGLVQTENNDSVVKIPYQTAIHDKLQKEAKLKSFDELKSPNDVLKMKTETKLKHFFKCVLYNCTFTTDDSNFFASHMKEHHEGKRLHCPFCLKEYYVGTILAEHMLQDHGRRCYQCSLCFYRAFSKPHVQIHIKNIHVSENACVYACSSHLPPDYTFKDEDENENTLATTWPYVCAIGDCKFQTYDPKEFKKHNDMTHRAVSVFFCYYCKVDFISFKRLMSHYHLHGINNFQCTYCVHGSDTKEEILLHLCNCHADKAFKVHVRAPQAADTTNKKTFSFEVAPLPSITKQQVPFVPPISQAMPPILHPEPMDITTGSSSGLKDDHIPMLSTDTTLKIKEEIISDGEEKKYPKKILCLQKDFYCRMPRCDEQFPDMNFYLKHLKEHHSSMNFLCPYCPVVAENLLEFTNHLLCHGPNLYACSFKECFWHHWQKESVVDHIKKVHHDDIHDATLIVIRHQNSDKDVLHLESFKVDPLAKHLPYIDDKAEIFICLFCNFKSSDKALMKNHIYQELVYKRFQCNLCKIKCYSRKEICGHFSSLHSGHNIKCTIDNNPETEFLVKNYLSSKIQIDIQEHFNTESIQSSSTSGSFCFPSHYNCESCSNSFSRMREYQSHLFYCFHKDYFPQICNYCESKCLDLAHVKYHTNAEHDGKQINFSTYQNILLEDQIGKKVRQSRFKILKDVMSSLLDKKTKTIINNARLYKLEAKSYKCGYCPFIDNFRSNIEKHLIGSHKDQPVKVEKMVSDLSSQVSLAANSEENSNDSNQSVADSKTQRYMCGFCLKQTFTLDELDAHVESRHSVTDEKTYSYFFTPDPNLDYSETDTDCYKCAYCSVSRENLYHLRRHCNNLHSAVPFKVCGQRIFKYKHPLIKCSYCSFKVASRETLLQHCNIQHLNMPLPVVPETSFKQGQKRKCESPSNNDSISAPTSAKQSKTDACSFRCTHCGESFVEFMKLLSHNKVSHPHVSAKYEKVSIVPSDSAIRLLQCEFCPFLGEKSLLEDHLSLKHKSRVSCGHCGKQFEYAIKIRAHNRKEHSNLPIKIVRPVLSKKIDPPVSAEAEDSMVSTCSEGSSDSRHFINQSSNLPNNVTDAGISHYGLKPEPVDLHNITVIMDTAGSRESAKLPVIYLCELFPMFPKVLVSDIRKDNR